VPIHLTTAVTTLGRDGIVVAVLALAILLAELISLGRDPTPERRPAGLRPLNSLIDPPDGPDEHADPKDRQPDA
jgi:hypothetical protein